LFELIISKITLSLVQATFILLGTAKADVGDWSKVKLHLGKLGKQSIKRRITLLNTNAITQNAAKTATKLLQHIDLDAVAQVTVFLKNCLSSTFLVAFGLC